MKERKNKNPNYNLTSPRTDGGKNENVIEMLNVPNIYPKSTCVC